MFRIRACGPVRKGSAYRAPARGAPAAGCRAGSLPAAVVTSRKQSQERVGCDPFLALLFFVRPGFCRPVFVWLFGWRPGPYIRTGRHPLGVFRPLRRATRALPWTYRPLKRAALNFACLGLYLVLGSALRPQSNLVSFFASRPSTRSFTGAPRISAISTMVPAVSVIASATVCSSFFTGGRSGTI